MHIIYFNIKVKIKKSIFFCKNAVKISCPASRTTVKYELNQNIISFETVSNELIFY